MFILLKKMAQNTLIGCSNCTLVNYEEAVKTLHSLQSNVPLLKSATTRNSDTKLKDTEKYLLRSGVTLEQLDTLSVIHVAGTKGKGSTCAFMESILRKHGFRTGFFSSPHLVSVRERIRINGNPISELAFTHYFWKLYKRLQDTREHESDMPFYFKFLTILMFNVFLDVNIDVAIIEVGIGGELDCTNIIRNPVCVGITSLGLDHTSVLGNTLAEIAYQKSGIFKYNTPAFTVPQPKEAMQVLRQRALEKNCNLYIAPQFDTYSWKQGFPDLGISSNVQKLNASLAIQMATKWMETRAQKINSLIINCDIKTQLRHSAENSIAINDVQVTNAKLDRTLEQTTFFKTVGLEKIVDALSSCKWPGRTQVLHGRFVDFYLDGAHTIESIECCISWFNNVSNKKGKRCLIFNTTGQRNSTKFLLLLKPLNFFKAYFVPNLAGTLSIDSLTNAHLIDEQKLKCKTHCEIWGDGSVFASDILEILCDIEQNCRIALNTKDKEKLHVLVTGSLHLVGAVLSALDPDLTMNTNF